MNVQNMLKYTADLSHGVTLTPLRMAFVRGEALAHMFIITAYENNQKVDLTGATINGYMMRGDQTTLTFDGSVSDGNAVISLPGAAYSVTGRFRLAIQATMNGVTATLFYGEGAVSPSTTDVIAIPEEIIMPSLENIEAQVEEMVAATEAAKSVIKGAVVRNLLDNSDFRAGRFIAQAGLNGKHGSTIYLADRWVGHPSYTAQQMENGLKIVSSEQFAYARQKVNIEVGKTYTVALKFSSVSNAVFLSVRKDGLTEVVKEARIDGDGIIMVNFTATVASVWILFYPGFSSSGGTSVIEWAALYEGSYTAETLPAYQPKGYAAELAECMRYFRPFIEVAPAVVVGQTSIQAEMVLDPPMRTTPTIVINGYGNAFTVDGEKTISASYPATSSPYRVGYVFYTANAQPGTPAVVMWIDGYLSCEP